MKIPTTGWDAKRSHMVDQHLRRRNIRDERVLEAMAAIPRELFMPEDVRSGAYDDEPAPIGHGQTISQPYMTALMAQALRLRGTETVLEVGTGAGYHAAVLAMLASRVVTIELVPELADAARRNLETAGLSDRVLVVTGDGSIGYPSGAPYDAISVAAAAPRAPDCLLEQLRDGGRLVIPVGSLEEQDLLVITRSGGKTKTKTAARCRFVPLRGGEGWKLS